MSETKLISGGPPVPDVYMVTTDQSSILGNGTLEHPLRAIAGPGGITLEDEGAPVAGNPHHTINFVGAGVVATDVAGVGTVTIPGGISGVVVEDEGGPLGSFTTLNFVGAGVTAANAGGGVASVTVPGGITLEDEGAPVTGNPHQTLNFVGAGVAATDVAGVGTVTVTDAVTISAVAIANTAPGAASQVVRVNPTAGGFNVTLPAAASFTGQTIVVKNVSSSTNIVVVLPTGGDTIDGAASVSLSGDRFFCGFTSDGVSDWMITKA